MMAAGHKLQRAMRIAMLLSTVIVAACASDKLAVTPPTGVDLSGHWKLNEADSDDALRLMQSQLAAATAGAGPGGQTGPRPGGPGGPGGRGSRGGAGAGGFGAAGPMGPVMPSVTVLDDALRWPGKDLILKQAGGMVTFTSGGADRACRPKSSEGNHQHRTDDAAHGRDALSHGRGDVPPPICGWDDKTLVVQSGDPEDERPPYELRFSLSEDGERLVELVLFKGGRSSGFVASREWNRL